MLCGKIYITKVLNNIVLLRCPAMGAAWGLRRFFLPPKPVKGLDCPAGTM